MTFFENEKNDQECPNFNEWKYGLEKPPRYVSNRKVYDESRSQNMVDLFQQKSIMFVAGQADNCCHRRGIVKFKM